MLFTSPEFILVFLPITFAGFLLTRRLGADYALAWLVVLSFFFYAYWNPKYIALLAASILFNYGSGKIIDRTPDRRMKSIVAATAIIANLAVLIFYKYSKFLLDNINITLGYTFPSPSIVLPLGISFITFQKIAYIADVYRGKVRSRGLLHFAFFVSFFPQLIAGPIAHHSEIMPQLNRGLRWSMRFMAVGLSLFALGLFKKVIVADGLAPMAEAAFHATDSGKVIASSSAWAGMLSYTLELYYDFSGYSDMACGLALLFGIRLPINFFSPYKSSSIIEFWRRWHMTLSRFLRDYVYFSLGGNRKGRMRTNINLLATMILGGFWHGASWTFAIWGAYHGVLLLINHAWRRIDAADDGASAKAVRRYPSIAVTFLAVSLGWILFKSATIAGAGRMFRSLVVDGDTVPQALDIGDLSQIVAALIAVWLLPNSFQIFRRYNPAVGRIPIFSRVFEWRPSIAWAFAIACCGAMALMTNRPTISFLYFQF